MTPMQTGSQASCLCHSQWGGTFHSSLLLLLTLTLNSDNLDLHGVIYHGIKKLLGSEPMAE